MRTQRRLTPVSFVRHLLLAVVLALVALVLAEHFDVPLFREAGGAAAAQSGTAGAPVFNAAGELQRPADYREWVFLSSGIGMTYGPEQPAAGRPPFFDNVFVTREAYRAFMSTGTWPDQTMFI